MSIYNRPGAYRQMDEASLQTDVMRFMAIVAFCLVAILAVVRNVDAPNPVPPTAAVDVPVAAPPIPVQLPEPPPQISPPATVPEVSVAKPAEPIAKPMPMEEPQPMPEPAPESVREPEPEPVAAAPIPQPVPSPVSTPERNPVSEPEPVSTPAPRPQPTNETPTEIVVVEAPPAPPSPAANPTEEERGLSLSFTSNQDFLRLLNNNAVAVYIFQDRNFRLLNSTYRFISSTPPKQFHQLDKATIPPLLHQTLAGSTVPEPTRWQWAVVLPPNISQQINHLMHQHEHGELQIDRYQRVKHVAVR